MVHYADAENFFLALLSFVSACSIAVNPPYDVSAEDAAPESTVGSESSDVVQAETDRDVGTETVSDVIPGDVVEGDLSDASMVAAPLPGRARFFTVAPQETANTNREITLDGGDFEAMFLPAETPPRAERVGGCWLFRRGTGNYVHAGSIRLQWDRQSFSVSPQGLMYPYSWHNTFLQAWRVGGEVSLRASGGVVPPFEGSVTFPPGVRVTAPSFSVREYSTVEPLRASWDVVTGQRVRVLIVGLQGRVECDFDGVSGNGFIPPNALSGLGMGAAYLMVGTIYQLQVMAGNVPVEISAMSLSFRQSVLLR